MSTSTSTSRGRRKKDRRKSSAPEPIRLVRVTDRSTGVLLFEGIYKWADHTNTANLGSLIQSFFQFAREVDGGEVESVFFEESPFLVVPTPRSGSSDPKTTVSAADAMKMIHNKTDDIIIVVFYECSDGSEEGHQENLSQFVGCLRDEFTKMFDDRLNRVRPKILSLSESSPDYDRELMEIQGLFREFSRSIDRLRQLFFATAPSSIADNSVRSLSTDVSFNFTG